MKTKLIILTTVPGTFVFFKGLIKHLSNNSFEVIGVSSSGDYLEEIALSDGIRTKAIEMSRSISPFKDLKSLWDLYRFFRKEKPTIVHTNTPKAGTVGMIAAMLAGVPIRIHTVHGLPLIISRGFKYKLLYCVEKITYRCAHYLWSVSYGIMNYILVNRLTTKDKIKVIHNGSASGFNMDYFSSTNVSVSQRDKLKSELNITDEDFVFVFVGRLVGDKGINELVSAFKNLQKKVDNMKLILVGGMEKELDPLLPETIREIESNNFIIDVGRRSDVRPYYAISDVLVHPSYREGFGNVIAEAGAMELPAIVSDITGCNEIIRDSVNGLIIPVKDESALEDAMLRIMNTEELYYNLKKNSRKMIRDRYEQKDVWGEILREYNALLVAPI